MVEVNVVPTPSGHPVLDTEDTGISNIDNKILESVNGFYDKYSKLSEQYKEKINDWHLMYNGISKRKGRLSNIFDNESYSCIETLVSDIYDLIMMTDPFFVAEPVKLEYEERKSVAQSLIRQQLTEIGFKMKFIKFLRKCGIDGIAFVRQPWRCETKKTTLKEMVDSVDFATGRMTKRATEITKERAVFDCFDFQICSINNIIFDPFDNLDDGRVRTILEISEVKWRDLKEMEKAGIVKDIERVKVAGIRSKTSYKEKQLEDKKKAQLGFDMSDVDADKYILYNFWDDIPANWLNETLSEDEYVAGNIIICNNLVIGKRENPYWDQLPPYFYCPWVGLAEIAFGIGGITQIAPLQEDINATKRLLLDHKNMSLYNMWLLNKNSGIKKEDLKIRPDGVIETDMDVDKALKDLRPNPGAFAEGTQSNMITKEDMRRISAATSVRQGIGQTKRQTLGEVQILQAQSGGRIKLIATTIAEMFVKPFLKRGWLLDQQYMTQVKVVQKIGSEGVKYEEVTPDEVYGEYDFIPKIMTDAENILTMRSGLLMMLDILTRKLPAETVNIYGLAKQIYELYGFKNAAEILTPPPAKRFMEQLKPEDEHKIIYGGKTIKAFQWEDHLDHITKHLEFRKQLMTEGAEHLVSILDKHIEEHFNYLQATQTSPAVPGGLPGMVSGAGMPPTTGMPPVAPTGTPFLPGV